ncbi:MAG: tRNA (adenosine(37)-N6)-dimethylallyltransferase MiaA [Proteobacteria bacterium]|jgi:tRNA dimethylallyltransferase|nr:tRNA (adenosine(37)-N6)-dimethylallyltransferase MiaA [Pseudomonadota bacterium]MDA1301298.1 tRNA (adenosine(37)-N6)-dimethylallyltransferase MiaA [Pseudomonadota bacterium]
MTRPRTLVITGPTASGKSGLALALARRFPIEIVSVDSAIVYRDMDIGTAKPTPSERRETPHHLIDIRDVTNPYSAAEFRDDAIDAIRGVIERGRIPCLVGGTMLYLKALRDGISTLPSASVEIRQDIAERATREGWPRIHRELQQVDPVAAARINPNDPQRLQRALEVYLLTGRSLTEHHLADTVPSPFELIEVAVIPDRQQLHRLISDRFHDMLDQGLVDEVRGLLERSGVTRELPAMKSVGYRQVAEYLAGEYDASVLADRAIAATRRLAKHQYTWLKGWPELYRLDAPDVDEVLKIDAVDRILQTDTGRPQPS